MKDQNTAYLQTVKEIERLYEEASDSWNRDCLLYTSIVATMLAGSISRGIYDKRFLMDVYIKY